MRTPLTDDRYRRELYGDVVVIDHVVGVPRMAGKDAEVLHTYMDLVWDEAVEDDNARQLIVRAIERLIAED